MQNFTIGRDHQTGKLTPVIRSIRDINEYGLTGYVTKNRPESLCRMLNTLEEKNPGLKFGLPEDCQAYSEYCGGVGHFVINTESNENGAYWDYYERFDNDLMQEYMSQFGVFVEWQNSAVLAAFDE